MIGLLPQISALILSWSGSASASGIRIWNEDSSCGSRRPKSCGSMRMRIHNTAGRGYQTLGKYTIKYIRNQERTVYTWGHQKLREYTVRALEPGKHTVTDIKLGKYTVKDTDARNVNSDEPKTRKLWRAAYAPADRQSVGVYFTPTDRQPSWGCTPAPLYSPCI